MNAHLDEQTPHTLLIANRGEIVRRVARTAKLLGLRTAAIYSADDAGAPHVRDCDVAAELNGEGPAAYLDVAGVVAAAQSVGATMLHPGYGFLSESAALAQACIDAHITFIGPDPVALQRLGDKSQARALATELDVPVLRGTSENSSTQEIQELFASLDGTGAIMIKAAAGGGGRGMRVVRDASEIESAVTSARSEALRGFGREDVYAEMLLDNARHVEVQAIGDGAGAVAHLLDRDCTLQRRHQKLIETAPAVLIDEDARAGMQQAAIRMLAAVQYRGLATVEFLVAPDDSWYFMEVNPRIQVEHTVTEQITGRDLVRDQIRACTGVTLDELGLNGTEIQAHGQAVQIRINAEKMIKSGVAVPSPGTVTIADLPSGPGVRVDTVVSSGYAVNPRFDSLLAKVIVHAEGVDLHGLLAFADDVLARARIEGVSSNISLQRALLRSGALEDRSVSTKYLDEHAKDLVPLAAELEHAVVATPAESAQHVSTAADAPAGSEPIPSPISGLVVSVEAAPGERVQRGQTIVVIEAMKMQHVIAAPSSGQIAVITVKEGAVVEADAALAHWLADDEADQDLTDLGERDLAEIRADLARLNARKHLLSDDARPKAVEKRHSKGLNTARENVERLLDDGSFVEYGGLAIAAQRRRRELDDLIHNTPADGMITGVGHVNGAQFDVERAKTAVLAYDYTVLAGTQGYFNHQKTDRVLNVAKANQLPVIFFAEGGGGRPGDLDPPKVAGLHGHTWTALAELSGKVPLISIVSGPCFAGNAAIVGCCDVIIATENSNIGMGGPAMIEGGGLGVFAPTDIGPIDVQTQNGVVDIRVADEDAAIDAAKKYLSYFQGDLDHWQEADQRELRHVVPENRLRAYDVCDAIALLADADSVMELRPDFGTCIVTALIRIEGRAMGLIANNPRVLGGAIDSDGADKAARHIALCDAFGLPIVSLCDTPGFMVGPESEKTAAVRHFSRMFVHAANASVPMAAVVLRKGYGLGAMAMVGGSMRAPVNTVAWPTGEFGGMGLEGYVRLGFRKELEAIADPEAREARYQELVESMYERGGGINTAMHLEIDDVIDPIDTRKVLSTALGSVPRKKWANARYLPRVDAW
ncbi:MAG: carboxyl transferase domain-containing protein [Cumulibacter sp.]